jgi:hypothetical protein
MHVMMQVMAWCRRLGTKLATRKTSANPGLAHTQKGQQMITMAIVVAAGFCYVLSCYKLAFWILSYAIVYGGLGALRGDNQANFLYRGSSGVIAAVLLPLAWHMGMLAGYL